MTIRYAIIEGGAVVNVALASAPLESNWLACPDEVGPGWLYDGLEFLSLPDPTPEEAPEAERAAMKIEA